MKKIFKNINIFILVVLILLGFSAFYFLYYRQRSQADVYIAVALTRGQSSSIPYWLDSAVSIGNNELSPLGGLNAEVYDKLSFDWFGSGRIVYLFVRINAIKDRTGIYLYKNKPLLVGGGIDLKLPKAQVVGTIEQISTEKIHDDYKKLQITVLGKGSDVWVAENLKPGSTIIDNKSRVLAKVLSVASSQSMLIGTLIKDANTNKSIITFDSNERDVVATIELLAIQVDNYYYFGAKQRIKVGEQINLPFQNVNFSAPITSIKVN